MLYASDVLVQELVQGKRVKILSAVVTDLIFCMMVNSLNDVRGDILGKARVSPFLIKLVVRELLALAWVAVIFIVL